MKEKGFFGNLVDCTKSAYQKASSKLKSAGGKTLIFLGFLTLEALVLLGCQNGKIVQELKLKERKTYDCYKLKSGELNSNVGATMRFNLGLMTYQIKMIEDIELDLKNRFWINKRKSKEGFNPPVTQSFDEEGNLIIGEIVLAKDDKNGYRIVCERADKNNDGIITKKEAKNLCTKLLEELYFKKKIDTKLGLDKPKTFIITKEKYDYKLIEGEENRCIKFVSQDFFLMDDKGLKYVKSKDTLSILDSCGYKIVYEDDWKNCDENSRVSDSHVLSNDDLDIDSIGTAAGGNTKPTYHKPTKEELRKATIEYKDLVRQIKISENN